LEKGIESLLGGIYARPRMVLKDLELWVENDSKRKVYQNRKIPGQLSFNNLYLKDKGIVVLGLSKRPAISSIIYVLVALYKGIGVTVLTRGKKSFSFWESVRSLFRQAGLPKEEFDVYLTTDDLILESFKSKECRNYVVDSTPQKVEELLSFIHEGDSVSGRYMKNFLTPFDAPSVKDFDRYFEQLSFVRAFAVNIMRHGAPMELEGESK
jgi:RHH-type proline utilization regulon transcriptional repressor/proline dehydrogenase/delta 1-pyrroline-5-carboxylate dehydrogenase